MSLPRAYCFNTKTIVDITTASQIYYSQPEPRHELTFGCANAACRTGENQQIILGINYTKIPGIDEFVQQPHFRTKTRSIHHHDCPYVDYQLAVDELDAEEPLNPPISGVKKSTLVEIFSPANMQEARELDSIDIQVIQDVKNIKEKKHRIEAIKDILRKIPNCTSRLNLAAKCFLAMTPDLRKEIPFQIEGHPQLKYSSYFKWAGYCDVNRRTPCIYYGRVNIQYLSMKDPFYALRFHKRVTDNDGNERTVTIRVPVELLQQSRDRAFYETILSSVAGLAGHNVMCFVYGAASFAEKTPDKHIDININHLHNLAIFLDDGKS
jgi:hypothetical protein